MLRAELHVHSTYSDGSDTPDRIVRRAVELELDCLSVTDHDTVSGGLSAMDYARDENLDIQIIPGVEVTTSDGHLLVLGVERDIDRRMSLKETVEAAKKQRGVCIIPHPFQIERKGVRKPELFRYADGIEVFNAKYVVGIFNWLARRYAVRYTKPFTAGSDAHSTAEMGYGITLFNGDFINSLLSGKTYIDGKKLPISLWLRNSLRRRI